MKRPARAGAGIFFETPLPDATRSAGILPELGRGSKVQIRLNGESREVGEGTTVGRLLAELGLHPQRVAVQRNLEIVRRADFDGVVLRSGDTVEVLTFMAGG